MTHPATCSILLVDDEDGIRFTLGCLLRNEGYHVDVAPGHVEAVASLQTTHYDLAFVDIMLAGESGIDVLHDIKTISPPTQVVMITARPEVKTAAEAVRLGAFDYITKPIRHETLLSVTRLALSAKKMNDERERYRANLDAIFRSVSDSIIMIDRNGALAHYNATAAKQCGFTERMIGSVISGNSLPCERTCMKALQETLAARSARDMRRFECRTATGRTCIVSLKSTPIIDADGIMSGAVAVVRDETPMVELERSLLKRSQFQGMIGVSEPMQRVYSLIDALAGVPTTVLVYGESGTGKELVASALHHGGKRSKGPFVKVNCSALSESLLESELFGHVRGAFTGAIAEKIGRFQKADKGTLFLDEIGDISPAIQMRLLRVLQESEFERVGDSTPIKVDVRIVAATNQNLADRVRLGTFRQDLYYRLNVVRLELPALRERGEDIIPLVNHFIGKFSQKFAKEVRNVSDEVMEIFLKYSWPGNIRELEHAMEHSVILCKSDTVTLDDLPDDLKQLVQHPGDGNGKACSPPAGKPALTLEEALAMTKENKAHAARLLGISRVTLYRHLEG